MCDFFSITINVHKLQILPSPNPEPSLTKTLASSKISVPWQLVLIQLCKFLPKSTWWLGTCTPKILVAFYVLNVFSFLSGYTLLEEKELVYHTGIALLKAFKKDFSYHILPCIMRTHVFVRIIRGIIILAVIPTVCNHDTHV